MLDMDPTVLICSRLPKHSLQYNTQIPLIHMLSNF